MGLTEREAEQQSIEMYCDEFIASRNDGDDPGEFGVENFDNWLESQGEGTSGLTEQELRDRAREAGFDPDRLCWTDD